MKTQGKNGRKATIKGLLIKPGADRPEIVEIPKEHDYTDIKSLMGLDSPLDCIERKIGRKVYDLWVDDEGLLKEDKTLTGILDHITATEILCGPILIVRHDGKGGMETLTEDDIINIKAHLAVHMMNRNLQYGEFGNVRMRAGQVALEYRI